MNNPAVEHMEAMYRILRYLKSTPDMGYFSRKHVKGAWRFSLTLTEQVQPLTDNQVQGIAPMLGAI